MWMHAHSPGLPRPPSISLQAPARGTGRCCLTEAFLSNVIDENNLGKMNQETNLARMNRLIESSGRFGQTAVSGDASRVSGQGAGELACPDGFSLRACLTFCSALVLISPAHATDPEWKVALDRANLRWQRASAEQTEARDEVTALEGRLKEKEQQAILLRARLASLNKQLADLSFQLPEPEVVSPEKEAHFKQRTDELVATSVKRVVILTGKNGIIGSGFVGQQEGATKVYASAPLIAANPGISAEALDGTKLPIGTDLSCPEGVDLACLQPTDPSQLSRFDLVAAAELPQVGDQVVIILVNRETRKLTGTRGKIRGIGPDTWELDVDFSPDMSDAPVLSLETGKVVGIVSPQVAGVSENWAVGTRHEAGRSFAARLDRVEKWQTHDIGRFVKEAEYVERINHKTRLAWAAHLLIGPEPPPVLRNTRPPVGNERTPDEQKKFAEEMAKARKMKEQVSRFAKQHAAEITIQRAQSWVADRSKPQQSGPGDLQSRRANIYRQMRTDLEDKAGDISAQLSWYHSKQLQSALEWRREVVGVMAENSNRLGQ